MAKRAPRGVTRNFMLAIAGALLFVMGYLGGSRYATPELDDISAVVLPEPVPLSLPDGLDFGGQWLLASFGDLNKQVCSEHMRRMAQIHNRMPQTTAEHPTRLDLMSIRTTQIDGLADSTATVGAYWRVQRTTSQGAQQLSRQFGNPVNSRLGCNEQPIALIDPLGQLRALFPASLRPGVAAADLNRLLKHFED